MLPDNEWLTIQYTHSYYHNISYTLYHAAHPLFGHLLERTASLKLLEVRLRTSFKNWNLLFLVVTKTQKSTNRGSWN